MEQTIYVIIAHDCDGDFVVYAQGFFTDETAAQAVIDAGAVLPYESVFVSSFSVQPIEANGAANA